MGRDLVLFLGAGFSWDARLPLMSEFGERSVATQPDIRRNATRRLAGPMILEVMETYLAFQKLCIDSKLLTQDDWLNVEEVFGVAEVLKYTGVKKVDIDGESVKIDELITRIKRWIWKTYQQLPVLRGANRKEASPNREPYEKFFSLLRDLGLAHRTTIITTNYDIVIEYCAHLGKVDVHYPMPWDVSFGVGSSGRYFVLRQARDESPRLCKLHGSVNFFQEPGGGVAVAADLGDGKEWVGRTPPGRFRNEPTIVMYDAIWKVQADYPGVQPAIVPPSYAKLEQTPWLLRTWREAGDALACADTVIFIGYSLPRTDGFMRGLLAGSQILRGRGLQPRVVVIDKSQAVRREYKELYHSIEPSRSMDFATSMERALPRILASVA